MPEAFISQIRLLALETFSYTAPMLDNTPTAHPKQETNYTWDLASIFPNVVSWRVEFDAVRADAARLADLKGTLGTDGEHLHKALQAIDALGERLGKVGVYASLLASADTRNDAANKMTQQVDTLSSEVGTLLAFVEPEILELGWERISSMLDSCPALNDFRYHLTQIERGRAHVLSHEQEKILGILSPLLSLPESIRDAAHDGDMRFEPLQVGERRVELSHGNIDELLQSSDRAIREGAYNRYADSYCARAKTFAATLTSQVTASLAFNRARNYSSTFENALFVDSFTPEVYHAAMRSCREHQDLFRRYFRAKARIIGVEKLAEHDIFAKLSPTSPETPYDRGVELVLDSLAPLGEEYVSIARRGLTVERWADVYPSPGKYSNAFSSGSYSTRPFLLLNYAPIMTEVGTLAHELGHSMHSLFTNRTQPHVYSSYAMTVAETASNLNQVLLRDHILKDADRDTTLAVLDEAFYFAHRYLFMMPILSRLEHVMHSVYARGGALGATDICKATVTAFSSAYGDSVVCDPERLGMKWAQFCHFYAPYYFFQYAVGISAAMSIGRRILDGEPGICEKYFRFLSAGGSMPPQEIFKIVDIDITSKAFYRDAFTVVEGYVERLERM